MMPLDADAKLQLEELTAKFLRKQQTEPLRKLGEAGVTLARLILETCPASTERTTALAYVDTAMLFAHASIDRHGE